MSKSWATTIEIDWVCSELRATPPVAPSDPVFQACNQLLAGLLSAESPESRPVGAGEVAPQQAPVAVGVALWALSGDTAPRSSWSTRAIVSWAIAVALPTRWVWAADVKNVDTMTTV